MKHLRKILASYKFDLENLFKYYDNRYRLKTVFVVEGEKEPEIILELQREVIIKTSKTIGEQSHIDVIYDTIEVNANDFKAYYEKPEFIDNHDKTYTVKTILLEIDLLIGNIEHENLTMF